MHYPTGNAEQLETLTAAEWLAKDGQQFAAKQIDLGVSVAEAICGSNWAWEREQKIEAFLRDAAVKAVRKPHHAAEHAKARGES